MGGKSPQTRNHLAVNELDIAFCIASQQEQSGIFGRKFNEVSPSLSTTCLRDYCWKLRTVSFRMNKVIAVTS